MRCEQKAEKPRTTLIDLQEFIDMLPMEQMKNAKTAAEELEFCDKFSKKKHLENFAKMTAEIGKALKIISLHLEHRSEQNTGKPRNIMIDSQELIDMFSIEQIINAITAAEELEFCDKFSKVKHLDNFAKMTVEIGKGFEQIALHLEDKMNKSNTNRKKKE